MTVGAVLRDGVLQASKNSRLPCRREFFRFSLLKTPVALMYPENRGIYTQSDSSKKSSRNIWSLAVVSVDQRY